MARAQTYETLIVGAGFSGLGAAIKLAQAGVDDIVILERSDRVGGTWRDTSYPGASCDIPSLLYSFSFAKNPSWSRTYSPADEIRTHLEEMTDRFDIRRRIEFGQEVTGLSFDEDAGVWTATTAARKRFRARTVVLASGPLPDSSFPDIRGIDSYGGHKIHSARWDSDYDFTGKRVGVIGTGASAIQIVPELVKQAEFVKVFQRTPGWVLPRFDFPTPPAVQTAFAKAPAVQQLARQALFWGHEASATALVWNTPLTSLVARLGKMHLRRQVKDPWLRRQLTPDFTPGCKRMLVSSDYYPALQRDNCKLIDWPIATLSPVGLRTSDGIEHHLDCIVFATGYDVHLTGPPFPVTGLGGRSLSAEWADGAQAYKSASAHGYPNLFFMTGPNSGPGHNSLLVYIEGQLDYAVRGITTILDNELRYLDVRHDVQRRYNERIQRRLTKTTWMSGCSSWYLTKDGHNVSMYPGFATQYLRQMRDFQYADYEAVEHSPAIPVSSSA
ncbi:NAD(P)/FAD-dependent oxidoreductase [Mycobacterium paraterrae]|uniref:NAD(P)/FAD-dependent oxidoreductase n=2 Tax=Mycobacterium paraterrae TaxID=577492 RepID=A0ABY3VTC9_9MYCO|nr:NAD(P)/FAD-dependent oxidoreductase [Mycobacterium paraterrae]